MYKILNQNSQTTEILLYSLIYDGITANKIITLLKETQAENITLRINSDGGEVFEGITLYNYLKDKNVTVIIDGICASAASVVAMSGKSITMRQGSMMMIHNPLTYGIGEAEELRRQADILDKITLNIAAIYSAKCGKPIDEIKALMKAETWMTSEEALAEGFVDEIEQAPEAESEASAESPDEIEQAPEAEAQASSDAAVKAERERLRLLDELYAPGREEILNRAKYETFESAQDIALELLKAEVPHRRHKEAIAERITNLPTASSEESAINSMAEMINAYRR